MDHHYLLAAKPRASNTFNCTLSIKSNLLRSLKSKPPTLSYTHGATTITVPTIILPT